MKFNLMIAIFLLGTLTLSPSVRAEVTVGDQVPEFEMVGSDGEVYSSEAMKGKKAYVIAWFPKAFTGGCTKECKSLRENGKALREFDVAYFTASTDDAETNAKFAESLDLDYPILSDPSKKVAQAFGVLNARGSANRWTYYIGKDGKVLHVDKKVKAAEHGETIADQLAKLGVDKKD